MFRKTYLLNAEAEYRQGKEKRGEKCTVFYSAFNFLTAIYSTMIYAVCETIQWEEGIGVSMNQISVNTPNPKCRLFIKIDQ